MGDEGFICMGGMAPRCPLPQAAENLGPVTLEKLQGDWTASSGAKITVTGTDVILNGIPLAKHKVTLDESDGTVVSVGSLWQLDCWTPSKGVQFRCSSTRDNMMSARADVWTRSTQVAAEQNERMKLLGYAGTVADPLGRGIEGCMPGTDGIEQGYGDPRLANEKDREEVSLLMALISQWREADLLKVRSQQVVPDATNRAQTGLGVELLHYIAGSMSTKGFQKRSGQHGHDIPVLVREPPGSQSREDAVKLWSTRVAEEEGFPPIRVKKDEEAFTSLGNGHFFQSLNLFDCQCRGINDDRVYIVGQDAALGDALAHGVPSIILRTATPRPVRAKIAALLNAKREFQWTLHEDGTVDTTEMPEENTDYCSQFEWLSKGMDAVQVDCLVRTHLGITDSKRILG